MDNDRISLAENKDPIIIGKFPAGELPLGRSKLAGNCAGWGPIQGICETCNATACRLLFRHEAAPVSLIYDR